MNKIKIKYQKLKKRLISALTVLLSMLLLINYYFIFEITPQPNDECLWMPKYKGKGEIGFFFDQVKFDGVTWNAGIRDGDELIEINGEKITQLAVANFELNKMSTGDSAVYKIDRSGYIFETKVEVKKLYQLAGLAFVLLATIWMAVGYIVIGAKQDGLAQKLFYSIGIALTFFSTFNTLIAENIINPIHSYRFFTFTANLFTVIGGTFLPFLLIHFFWVFPKRFKFIDFRHSGKIIYSLPILIIIVSVAVGSNFISDNLVNAQFQVFNFYRNLSLGLLFIASGIGLISLFINYMRLKTKVQRDAIFIILIAFGIGIASALYTTIIGMNVGPAFRYNSPEYFLPIILIALLPLAFAFSIFKYSLMDVSDVVKNTIMYSTATVAVAGIYFLVIYFVGQSFGALIGTDYQAIIAGVVFILFAIVFQSTKDKFQEIITKKFYPEQFAYQKVILKFSNDISTIVGLDNILDSVTETFVEALRIKVFGIVLSSEKENSFNLVRNFGFKSNEFEITLDMERVNKFLETKRSLNQEPVVDHQDYEIAFGEESGLFNNFGIYTVLPLIVKNRIIGFILFGLKHSGSNFAGRDLELLHAAANQTAISIENARLYESEKERLKIDRDLENARRIQTSLLPNKFPEILGLDISGTMIPAMMVGGDYFDLIKVSDTKLLVIVGDVSGKGLSAALYMSRLQTMIQLYVNEERSPKDLLMDVNRKIYENIEKNWFITVSIALIDTEKKHLKFCRAGHTPLIVSNNGKAKVYTPSGIGIGLEKGDIFDSTIDEVQIDLKEGDTLVFYSDGISEAMNDSSELFGDDKLIDLVNKNGKLSSEELLSLIVREVEFHQGLKSQHDDLTLVLIKNSQMPD